MITAKQPQRYPPFPSAWLRRLARTEFGSKPKASWGTSLILEIQGVKEDVHVDILMALDGEDNGTMKNAPMTWRHQMTWRAYPALVAKIPFQAMHISGWRKRPPSTTFTWPRRAAILTRTSKWRWETYMAGWTTTHPKWFRESLIWGQRHKWSEWSGKKIQETKNDYICLGIRPSGRFSKSLHDCHRLCLGGLLIQWLL